MYIYSTKQFSYNKERHLFIAEASDICRGTLFGQLYPDACDVGLILLSHVTGRQLKFAVFNEHWSDDEFQYWELSSNLYDNRRKYPYLETLSMIIYND